MTLHGSLLSQHSFGRLPRDGGPIQDAITLYTWHHIVDRYRTLSVVKAAKFFHRYLTLMPLAIHPTLYLGFQPHLTLFPNAPYHFPINGGWPLQPTGVTCSSLPVNFPSSSQTMGPGDR